MPYGYGYSYSFVGGSKTSPLSITAPSAYSYLTSASPYGIGSTLQVADSEDVGGNYTVAITLTGGGTLTLSGTTGLTGSGDGTSSLSYSGTLSAWNTALNGADIAGLSDETATMSITMTRDADSLEVSRNVTVNAYPALAITTLAPADDATGVAYDRATYTATFNRNIQAGTGNVVLKLVGGAALETFDIAAGTGDQGGTVTISGADLVITLGVNLTDNTAHAIQIAATAVDGSDIGTGDSFAGIADDTTWSFTCEDTTPTLSAPLDSQTGGTTATAAVTTDRGDGTLWWVVTTSATTPSHAQIKAGQDHTGSAAAADGSQAVTATGSQGVSITGLTAETQYYTHLTQESANDAAATPVSADGFLTPDTTEPVLNSSVPADNATGVAVDSTIVLTFDENVILTTGGGNITLRKLDGSWTVVETFSRSTDTTGTGDNGGSISISGAVVTITPGADMAESTTHALQVAADCLENEAGHAYAGITDDTTLNWQTGIADTYAVEGFSPPVVADFENEYYRVGGSDSDFDSMFTYTSGDALSTMVDSDGLLKWAPHNLITYSQDFDQSTPWLPLGFNDFGAGSEANTTDTLDPAGGNTAEFLQEDTSTGQHRVTTSTISAVAGAYYTASFFVKKAGRTLFQINSTSSSRLGIRATFDIDAGTVTDEGAGSASIVDAGNGWYLCTVRGLSSASGNVSSRVYLVATGTTNSYTGDGSSGIYIWGAHVYRSDLGGMVDVPTDARVASGSAFASYVPTTTAAKYLPRRGNHVYNGTSWVNKGILLETEARTNLLLNSGTLSTQNVTTTAQDYTLSFTGTGTVTLSGTSTAGPLVGTGTGEENRVNLTFTPTAGTLTLTVSGTVTNAQLEAGSTPSSYIPTSGATVTRPAQALTIPAANMSYSDTAVSFAIKGTQNLDGSTTRTLMNWYESATNRMITQLNPNDPYWYSRGDGGIEAVTFGSAYPSGINVDYSIADRRVAGSVMQGAKDGVSSAPNVISDIPDLTGIDCYFAAPSPATSPMGNLTLFRQWDDDITQTGIETAST
jgi:hypothetical protein